MFYANIKNEYILTDIQLIDWGDGRMVKLVPRGDGEQGIYRN